MNKVILTGNLGKDAEVKTTTSGTEVTEFQLMELKMTVKRQMGLGKITQYGFT